MKLAKLSLAHKFYLTLALPLILISVAVTFLTFQGLRNNAADLSDILKVESKANRILSLLLVQDDASKAMLIDPNQLETFSAKKIEAYDELKSLLGELEKELRDGEMKSIIAELETIDEQKLRPIDTRVLELLFENVDQAREMYFKQYEPQKMVYEGLIRRLADKGTLDLHVASQEMHEKNLRSLLQIGLALLLGILVVFTTITILTRQVEKSDSNTKSLLAVLSEGLFFFDSKGTIAAERSQVMAQILPGSEHLTSLTEFFSTFSKVSAKNIETCLELLWDKDSTFFSDAATTLSLLPKEMHIAGDRIIRLEYRPLYSPAENLDRVVVVVADVTQKLKNDREMILQAERVRKMSRVASSIDTYFVFLEEAIGLFRRATSLWSQISEGKVKTLDKSDGIQLKRDLHTLKGSLGAFEFASIAARIHELETRVEEGGWDDAKALALWEQVKDQWKFETSDIEHVLGLQASRDKVSIQKVKFVQLQSFAQTTQNRDLQLLLDDSLRYPLREGFAKYESYLDKLASRSNDKQVRVAYKADSADLTPSEVQKLDAALIHILRNSLDHGIEDSELRTKNRKSPWGTIQIACYRQENGTLHLIIKDDGQGINADRLAQKVVERGIWTPEQAAAASFQDKIELIFLPDLSTKDVVSDISGRGVGMDAVKSWVEGLGGKITVFSQPGQGTQFEIDVPTDDTGLRSLKKIA